VLAAAVLAAAAAAATVLAADAPERLADAAAALEPLEQLHDQLDVDRRRVEARERAARAAAGVRQPARPLRLARRRRRRRRRVVGAGAGAGAARGTCAALLVALRALRRLARTQSPVGAWMVRRGEIVNLCGLWLDGHGLPEGSETLGLSSRVRRAAPSRQMRSDEPVEQSYGLAKTAALTMLRRPPAPRAASTPARPPGAAW